MSEDYVGADGSGMAGEPTAEEWREAVHYYGEAICEGCGATVDLSDADTVNGGVEIWNEHIREEHPEKVDA